MTNEELIEAIESTLDFLPQSYSGRGMVGSRCVGVVCSDKWKLAMQLAAAIAENHEGSGCQLADILNEIGEPRVDNMGMDLIVYWPMFEWPEGREDHSDEEDE